MVSEKSAAACQRVQKERRGLYIMSLTKRQEATMKKHSVHHGKKHMSLMRKMMEKGSSFTEAHKAAMKKVGK